MEQGSIQGKQAIDRLVGLGNMRVWSVIISIFGDAVLPRRGVIAASTLAIMTESMGVKPEAFRVAVSRLTKDGWIERTKNGRLSFYQLSTRGSAEFTPAVSRIYAKEAGPEAGWQLVVLATAQSSDLLGETVSLGGRAFLSRGNDSAENGLRSQGPFLSVPDWVKQRVGPDDLAQSYVDLKAVLQAVSSKGVTDLEAAVIRVLVVHQWRRLVLRHADLPARFFPKGWQGEACRALVQARLVELSERANRWFDNHIS